MKSAKSARAVQQYDAKLKRKALKPELYSEAIKSEARLAAQHASQQALREVSLAIDTADDDSSAMSTEVAVQRGSMRALEDSFGSSDGRRSGGDHDTSATTEVTNSVGTSKKKKKNIFGRVNPVKGHVGLKRLGKGSDESAASKHGAWMCGCCGKVFSSYNSAEVHEKRCVQGKLKKYGLIKEETPSKSPARTPQMNRANSAEALFYSARSMRRNSGAQETVSPTRSVNFADPTTPIPSPPENAPTQSILRQSSLPVSPDSSRIDRRNLRARYSVNTGSIPEWTDEDEDMLLSDVMRNYLVLPDEALVDVVLRSTPLTLTPSETKAERNLRYLARDKAYYDAMEERVALRNSGKLARSEGKGVLSKVQNKFVDAYQLIKEGDTEGGMTGDQYMRKKKVGAGSGEISHDDGTLYVNVIVKQSFRVVSNELERLAKQQWGEMDEKVKDTDRFLRFRAFAQLHAVKLAGLALASDFTPRRIAVQLSNDLYRLMTPQLKRLGVTIETEIEYRVGPYFVLAVNIKSVDMSKLMKHANRDYMRRLKKWEQEKHRREELRGTEDGNQSDEKQPTKLQVVGQRIQRLRNLGMHDIISAGLAWMYLLPSIISIPILYFLHFTILSSQTRIYILATVTDDIFKYVEEKGMEMEIRVMQARYQASFMLAALRELREDSRELKKKRLETEGAEAGAILGPFLGPAIKSDKVPAEIPPGFQAPENLEFVGLEMDLPVGYKRLRWAVLNPKSRFLEDAVYAAEANYEDITIGEWTVHNECIGLPSLPDGIKPEDFVGAEREASFLMPKSAFIKANMAFETNTITYYNDYCFCIKKHTRTPDVPYGGTFIAWTQLVFFNTGNDSCRMVCSVEAEFPNGSPMVARQIQSGMRAGTAEVFVLMGETICKYADAYP